MDRMTPLSQICNFRIHFRLAAERLSLSRKRDAASNQVALRSKLNDDVYMPTDVQQWFENAINDFSFNSAAKQSGLSMSTVRRHLVEEPKTGSAPETIVRICRAYHLNPVAALITAGLVSRSEVRDFAKEAELAVELRTASAEEIIERVQVQLRQLEQLLLPYPGQSEQQPLDASGAFQDPDYSKLSVRDARDYGLAAKSEDERIAPDELPNQP